ncbi:MAG: N-acetyl-gamma-glutamyl-phosphate reductase [Candidatus Omnitrophica bacterium]|nr:N-acetyl-gamma-glutamyl-phosphate reductase [Candidatus Omnitrophota bacterium]
MVKAAIVGATGYTGEELIRILVRHPQVQIQHLIAHKSDHNCPVSKIFPWLEHILDMECSSNIDVEKISQTSDVIFLALPHRVSMGVAPDFLNRGKRVIDLSADYRLKNIDEYQKWYASEHKSKEFVPDSVYGLCELKRDAIKTAQLVANPGCYPTGAILACAPFLKKKLVDPEIIIDAKSGTSGAGRAASVALLFSEVNENFKAYKVGSHQHTPEIVQELGEVAGEAVQLTFVPHLVPMTRGILSTIYMNLRENISVFEAVDMARKFYLNEPFVRVRDADVFPEIQDVVNSNFCDIGIKVDQKRLIVIAAIDNLVKGAAGQAVQNCNIMFGLKETLGLLP